MSTNLYDGQLVRVWNGEEGNATVSPAVNRAFFSMHSIQYISDGVETLLVETSLDGDHWIVLDASQDPNTIVNYERHLQWLRFTKGAADTVSVIVGGVAEYGS